jgi:flavodoxin short chain
MSKVAVVFWSGTGNTEQMAEAVAEGAKSAGAEVTLANVNDFDSSSVADFDGIAFGCPAMGAEVLEDSEFEPVFNECESALNGKSIALFGSYGWGDGEWMRDWEARMQSAGAELVGGAGLMCHETPDAEGLEECRELGRQLANA